MSVESVLITGGNRGIGLELVKQLANRAKYLFATCRKPNEAEELNKLCAAHKNITVLQLDVCDESSIDAVKEKVSEIVGDDGLTCLINNAGQMDVTSRKVENLTPKGLMAMFEINTIAPAMIAKAFLPMLRRASSNHSSQKMGLSRASIINVSTKVGSIADNSSGSMYGYRMSKTALNMLTKNLSIELKEDQILAVCVHPGWVLTDMGGPNALTSTEQCVEGMLNVLGGLGEKDNGLFHEWNGKLIPW